LAALGAERLTKQKAVSAKGSAGRNQPLARFIAREKTRMPRRLVEFGFVFRRAVNRCADNCAGWVPRPSGGVGQPGKCESSRLRRRNR